VRKLLAVALLATVTGCTSNGTFIEHPYKKGSGDKYAATNEGRMLPNGIGLIRYEDGPGMYDDGNEQATNKKMYEACNGKYKILKRKASTPENAHSATGALTVTVLTTFQCI
jgi:hypothetical protein